jgi:hypothetical protein
VVHEQSGQVVASKLTSDVDKIVQPQCSHLVGAGRDNLEEDVSEDLVAVEGEIVAEPTQTRRQESVPVVVHCEFQGGDIVSGNLALLPGRLEIIVHPSQLVYTNVQEEKKAKYCDPKRDSEGCLSRDLAVSRVDAMVEDQHEDDEDQLIP